MRARVGVGAFLLGLLGCVLTAAAGAVCLVKIIADGYAPAIAAPGLILLSLVCSLLLVQLGTYIQGQAYGYTGSERRRGEL